LKNKIHESTNKRDSLRLQLENYERCINEANASLSSKDKYLATLKYEIEKLKQQIHVSNLEIEDLRRQLDEHKVYTSLIIETKTTEINDIIKNINETVKNHNNLISDREIQHRNNINRLEENKQLLINKHSEVKNDLNNTI
jgi:chromosome segregation ATPase